jgi:membrane protein required for colicin V production
LGLVDILILVVLAVFLIKGLLRGLLKEICSLLGLVLGGVFAFTFHVPLAQFLQDSAGLPGAISVWAAFLAVFLGVVVVFAVLGFVLHRFAKIILLGGVNRLAGGVFGLIQAVVILAMLIIAMGSQPAPAMARQLLGASHLAPPFATLGETLLDEGRALMGRSSGR